MHTQNFVDPFQFDPFADDNERLCQLVERLSLHDLLPTEECGEVNSWLAKNSWNTQNDIARLKL